MSLSPSCPFPSFPVVFYPTDFHPSTFLLLIPPPYSCLQDLGFMCLNDLFQAFNHISRPTFSLTPPTSPSSADFLLLAQLLPSALRAPLPCPTLLHTSLVTRFSPSSLQIFQLVPASACFTDSRQLSRCVCSLHALTSTCSVSCRKMESEHPQV